MDAAHFDHHPKRIICAGAGKAGIDHRQPAQGSREWGRFDETVADHNNSFMSVAAGRKLLNALPRDPVRAALKGISNKRQQSRDRQQNDEADQKALAHRFTARAWAAECRWARTPR